MEKALLKKAIRKADVRTKNDAIRLICEGKKVLDVGCVGQDFGISDPDWLHNIIKSVAGSVTGVDIVREKIDVLKNNGYRMLHISEMDSLQEEFDVIVMADVIEHVNDPVDFLKFYSRFLGNQGIIFVSTPNAHRALNFLSILFLNNYSVNEEHTCWFCPRTLHEVVTRAGLELKEIYWLKRYYPLKGLSFVSAILTVISDALSVLRRSFHQNFMVILSK